MPKCNKVKNPCKICLGRVSAKTGIQCQGACKTWIHYACLNYTPGKIKDIKAGIIKVSCPCPDCNTSLPKEYRTDEPFSCNNTKCPANGPPKCGNTACPINTTTDSTDCALDQCGKGCKANSTPLKPDTPPPPVISPCEPKNHPFPTPSDNCIEVNAYPSGNASSNNISGDYGYINNSIPSMGALEQMCNTVGQLSHQINQLMSKMQRAVHDRNGGSAQKTCPQSGPRSMCPKPCFCPGNPGKR